jgi:hypothetical protein
MFEWILGLTDYGSRILDKLTSGENKKYLIITLIAVVVDAFCISIASSKIQTIIRVSFEGSPASVDILILIATLIGIIIFTGIAYAYFHSWLSDASSKEQEYLDNLALIEKTRSNTNKDK